MFTTLGPGAMNLGIVKIRSVPKGIHTDQISEIGG